MTFIVIDFSVKPLDYIVEFTWYHNNLSIPHEQDSEGIESNQEFTLQFNDCPYLSSEFIVNLRILHFLSD